MYASDDGLTTRTASGPMVNYDDPDAYWDQMEGGRTSAPTTDFLPVKYVEAAGRPAVLGDLADLNADVRGDALNYRDPAIATPQDKVTGVSSATIMGALVVQVCCWAARVQKLCTPLRHSWAP